MGGERNLQHCSIQFATDHLCTFLIHFHFRCFVSIDLVVQELKYAVKFICSRCMLCRSTNIWVINSRKKQYRRRKRSFIMLIDCQVGESGKQICGHGYPQTVAQYFCTWALQMCVINFRNEICVAGKRELRMAIVCRCFEYDQCRIALAARVKKKTLIFQRCY